MNQIKRSTILVLTLFIIIQVPVFGAEEQIGVNPAVQYTIVGIVLFTIVAALMSLISMNFALLESIKRHEGIEMPKVKKVSIWQSFRKKMIGMIPIEKEHDILLHHNYDGIQELDNNLPPWWLYGFYLSIVFSIVYIGYYHFSESSMNSSEEYDYEVQQAKIEVKKYMALQSNEIDEDNIEALTDVESINYGQLVFKSNCVTCHLEGGGGSPVSVGPNLTDEYWIHGGDMTSIFNTIKYGVPEKGMIAWKSQLSNADMHKVTSYIASLQGTNPPNAKEPQGEKYITEETAELN